MAMDWLLRYTDKLSGVPSAATLKRYLGSWDAAYLGYATAEETRARAASGGVVSALLIDLLERGKVQGALVSRVEVADGQIQAHPFIARTLAEILQAQSSIYMEFPWLEEARSLLAEADGRVALVGLPCAIAALRRLEARDPALCEKIALHIALVCGRSSSKELLLEVLARKGIREADVAGIRFREGHWRGQMRVWLQDGTDVAFPFEHFSLYRNLHFGCPTRCLSCADPLGEHADVVCGDVWLYELKARAVKHSLVLSRSPQATAWLEAMSARGVLMLEAVPPEMVFRAQRRGLIPAKRGKAAKAQLARLFGYRMRYESPWRSRWNDYLVAAMVLLNYRWAANPRWRQLIFRLPRWSLRLGLTVLSLFKNL
jgi:coenzyme F420 hydrogenase subunit beta